LLTALRNFSSAIANRGSDCGVIRQRLEADIVAWSGVHGRRRSQ
jgi:hypothetical protein